MNPRSLETTRHDQYPLSISVVGSRIPLLLSYRSTPSAIIGTKSNEGIFNQVETGAKEIDESRGKQKARRKRFRVNNEQVPSVDPHFD